MTKKALTREQKVFKELAASGKYVNTGKVLIGLTYQPKPAPMTDSEEFIQNLLLDNYRLLVSDRAVRFSVFVLVLCFSLVVYLRT